VGCCRVWAGDAAARAGGAALVHTPGVEPETHRLDREAMLAEHQAVAERVRREVDEAVAAAAEKRRASFEQFFDHMRAQAATRREYERIRTPTASERTVNLTPSLPGARRSGPQEEADLPPRPPLPRRGLLARLRR
jgi:hypothetical protein